MEFFIGAMTTLVCIVSVNRFISNDSKKKIRKVEIAHSQAFLYDAIGPLQKMLEKTYPMDSLDTQSIRYLNSLHTKVAFAEDKAYWIENNTLFQAEVIEGNFQKENAKRVDTMGMGTLELNKIAYIVEQLTEATGNDFGNTGKSNF